jgi:polysaccharide biosynthesis/export protein
MINRIFLAYIFIAIAFLISCSEVLEPVELNVSGLSEIDYNEEQQNFKISIKPLNLAQAKKSKNEKYKRFLIQTGNGDNAKLVSETSMTKNNPPPQIIQKAYTIGTGDEITLKYIIDDTKNGASADNNVENLLTTSSRVSSAGDVLLLGIGRVKAKDLTISELRNEVKNIFIQKGSSPYFQLEISEFRSRKAFVFDQNARSSVITLTDKPLALEELIAQINFKSDPGALNIIILKRAFKYYTITFDDLLSNRKGKIFIENQDQIQIKKINYKPGQVYALSGGQTANIIKITPELRSTMADVLFIPGGPLENINAKRSEIYLLRGQNPTTAYHLNAQNVSKILIAAEMELRPDDILFVAQRPIISFSRLLSELNPLRSLLRDIKNNNIP